MKNLASFGCLSLLLLIPLTFPTFSSAENILAVAFTGSKSHKNAFDPIYIELARRGHKVTVIHPVKSGYTEKNMKEITGPNYEELKEVSPESKPPNLFDLRLQNIKARVPIHPFIVPLLEQGCRSFYELPEVKAVLKQKFALVFVASHMNECTYGFVHKLNTSTIFVHPLAMEHYKLSSSSGDRPLPSFVPYYATGMITNEMGFVDRIYNGFAYVASSLLYDWYYVPKMEALYRRYLGEDVPSIREIEGNASLVFQNSHFSLTYPKPQFPNVIDVGCVHCKAGKELPKELQEFVEGSGKEGFILFSLGSHVKGSDMPDEILKNIVQTFGKLKQRVIWKFDLERIPNLPGNVRLVQWAPQQDLLAHKNMRLFISHGGLLSTMEAAYHGVPMIGVPLFGDQHDFNVHQVQVHGFGVSVELRDLNVTSHLLEAINKILSNPSYGKAAKAMGERFRDRQAEALQTAVYWAEYVIRHKGAVHLRSPASKLNFFVYYGLDVIAFLACILGLLIFIPVKSIQLLCCGGKAEKTEGRKKAGSRSKKNQ